MTPDMSGVKMMLECICAIGIVAGGMCVVIALGIGAVALGEHLVKRIVRLAREWGAS